MNDHSERTAQRNTISIYTFNITMSSENQAHSKAKPMKYLTNSLHPSYSIYSQILVERSEKLLKTFFRGSFRNCVVFFYDDTISYQTWDWASTNNVDGGLNRSSHLWNVKRDNLRHKLDQNTIGLPTLLIRKFSSKDSNTSYLKNVIGLPNKFFWMTIVKEQHNEIP